jgi:DNA-binding MarR family transcriptional regulator
LKRKKSKTYRPPVTISRSEFLTHGSDVEFRHSIYAMVQSVGRLLACRDAFGRELDLTPSQFVVLMGVAHCQGTGGVTIRELADHVALASTHVTTEVGRLERVGFLTKQPSASDRRSVRVSLMPHGEQEIVRVAPFVRLINDVLFRDIDPEALQMAHHVARQLILNSENALAEVRRHHLEKSTAKPFAGNLAGVASHEARRRYPAASRSADRNEAGTSVQRGKAKGRAKGAKGKAKGKAKPSSRSTRRTERARP